MDTPIYDFVNNYAHSNGVRAHMPGHKGEGELESIDITEITGADSLFEADGIISESERNAGEIFGAYSFTVEEDWSLENLSVAVLILDKDSHVNNMAICAADGGKMDYEYLK